MADLPSPFMVRIDERKKTKRPRVFDYYHVADIESGTSKRQRHGLKHPKSAAYDYIEKMLAEIEFPYLSVRRSFFRDEVLELSGADGTELVDEVLQTLHDFHPLVEYIND